MGIRFRLTDLLHLRVLGPRVDRPDKVFADHIDKACILESLLMVQAAIHGYPQLPGSLQAELAPF